MWEAIPNPFRAQMGFSACIRFHWPHVCHSDSIQWNLAPFHAPCLKCGALFGFQNLSPRRFYPPHVWADLRVIGSSQTRSWHTTMITISLIPNIWISCLNTLLEFRYLSSHFWTENRKSNIWRLLCWGQRETAVHMMDDTQDVLWHSGAFWLRPKNNRDMKRDSCLSCTSLW